MPSYFSRQAYFNDTVMLTLTHGHANTWTPDVIHAFQQQLSELQHQISEPDAPWRVLIITGAGERYFSAGADLDQLAQQNQSERQASHAAFAELLQQLLQFPLPTIAAINGYALGWGLDWALACDVCVAETPARLGYPEVTHGLTPYFASALLARRVSPIWQQRLMISGQTISSQMAQHIGLIEEKVESGCAKIAALSLAQEWRQGAPHLQRQLKQQSLNTMPALHLLFNAWPESPQEAEQGLQAYQQRMAPWWRETDD